MMISVFLDESGTHVGSDAVLVGAIVTPDVGTLEQGVVAFHSDAVANTIFWESDDARDEFIKRGFHHKDDNVTLRNFFYERMRSLDFRAHVAFSRRESLIPDESLLVNMYYTLCRNICLRYRSEDIAFIFENETSFDPLYSKIIDTVVDDLRKTMQVEVSCGAFIATKAAPALGIIDYVLAISAAALRPDAKNFEKQRLNAGLPAHFAHLIDFDRKVHQSARKGVELL